MTNKLDNLIKKHEDSIEYHKQQIEKLKERKRVEDEMKRRGYNGYSPTDFKKKVLDRTKSTSEELKTKNYKTVLVGGKTFYVTSDGEVYSELRKYKCSHHLNGYQYASLNGEGRYVHRLVWEAFNGEIPQGMEIDHINTNRLDNRLCNLRLVSSSENKRNPLTIGKYKESNKGKPHTYEQRMKASMGVYFSNRIKKYHKNGNKDLDI